MIFSRTAFHKVRAGWLRAAVAAAALVAARAAQAQDAGGAGMDPGGLAPASAALADGQYAIAEKILVKYLAAHRLATAAAGRSDALRLLCHARAMQGRYGDVIDLLDGNADIVAEGDPRDFTFWRARAHLGLGEPEKALALIDPAARLAAATNDTANLRLVRLAADAYAAVGDAASNGKAEEALDFFLKTAPAADPAAATDDARLLKARLLARRGETAAAVVTLAGVADSLSADRFTRANALVELVALSATNAPAARWYAVRLSRLPLGKSAASYTIPCGRTLASRRETAEDGARMLKQAIMDSPTSPEAPEAQFALSEAWLSAGSNALAAAEFKNFLETYGSTPERVSEATAGRAEALYRLGEFSEAATLFQKAAQTATGTLVRSILDMRAADALYAEGKYEAAANIYGDIPLRAHSVPGMGKVARFIRGLYPDAAAGDEFNFHIDRARFMEADALERCGRAEDAQKRFETLAGSPFAAGTLFAEEAQYRSALLLERQNRGIGSNQAAINGYSSLIASTTNAELRSRAFLGRGRCHYRNWSLPIAISDFTEAEKGDGETADEAALYHIQVLDRLGQSAEAVKRAEEFRARRPASPTLPSVAFWLAQYPYNGQDFAKAQALFLDFAKKWPENARAPEALLWAAKALLHQGENQAAADTLAELGQRYGSSQVMPEARYLQAKALSNLTRFEDVVLVVNDAAAKFPASEYTTRSLILRADAIFALCGSATSGYGIPDAVAAYDTAATRADATVETRLECNYKRARCLEKGGDAQSALDEYYNQVILAFYELAGKGSPSDACVLFYERAAFAAARIRERQHDEAGALGILRRLTTYNTPEREQALREIDRIENGRE